MDGSDALLRCFVFVRPPYSPPQPTPPTSSLQPTAAGCRSNRHEQPRASGCGDRGTEGAWSAANEPIRSARPALCAPEAAPESAVAAISAQIHRDIASGVATGPGLACWVRQPRQHRSEQLGRWAEGGGYRRLQASAVRITRCYDRSVRNF
jgi:hypothetical protein